MGDGYCLKDRTTVSPICSPYDNSQQRCNNAFTLVDCKWSWFPGSPPATAPDCLLVGSHIVSGLCTLFTDAASCNRAANCDWTGPVGLPTSPPTPAPPTGWCLQDGTTVSSLCNAGLESVCNSKSNFRCSWSTTPAAPTPAPATPDCLLVGTVVSSLCTPLTDAASCNRAVNCNWAGTASLVSSDSSTSVWGGVSSTGSVWSNLGTDTADTASDSVWTSFSAGTKSSSSVWDIAADDGAKSNANNANASLWDWDADHTAPRPAASVHVDGGTSVWTGFQKRKLRGAESPV